MINKKIIWMAWEKHIRSIELTKKFNIDFYFFDYNYSRFIKHPLMIYKTYLLIIKIKPNVLIVQSPSIFLSLLAIFIKNIYGYRLIIDAHNAAIIPDNRLLRNWFYFIYKYIHRKGDTIIVTNVFLKSIVEHNGGQAFVLPDVLPEKRAGLKKKYLKNKKNIVYICTFGTDEPYVNVINSAKYLPKEISIYITGNYKNLKNSLINNLELNNIIFTGFIPEEEYWDLLFSADIIMDLTLRDNCLVAGAYEAVSLKKPLILSDTSALRDYFYRGVVHIDNTAEGIGKAISEILNNYEYYVKEVEQLNREIKQKWEVYARDFLSLIEKSV